MSVPQNGIGMLFRNIETVLWTCSPTLCLCSLALESQKSIHGFSKSVTLFENTHPSPEGVSQIIIESFNRQILQLNNQVHFLAVNYTIYTVYNQVYKREKT